MRRRQQVVGVVKIDQGQQTSTGVGSASVRQAMAVDGRRIPADEQIAAARSEFASNAPGS